MKRKPVKRREPEDGTSLFRKLPFSVLVRDNEDLAAVRAKWAAMPPQERREAADFQYHSDAAASLFNNAMALSGSEGLGEPFWPSGILALAIDPLYAPALLTVGSIEYQVGRIGEAMQLFSRLTEFPADEEDLSVIIDKAGDFLIDQKDCENALLLYEAAEKAFPREAVYPIGSGYCLGTLGRHEESIEKHRRADELEPDNYKHLNDLGYALFKGGKLDEAEEVLERSIALSPADYALPRGNLKDVRRKKKRLSAGAARTAT